MVTMDKDGEKKTWRLEELNGNRQIVIDMRGKDLKTGNNTVDIQVQYRDKEGNEYADKETAIIRLGSVKFHQKVFLLLGHFERKYLTPWVYISVIAIFFFVTLYLVLRK